MIDRVVNSAASMSRPDHAECRTNPKSSNPLRLTPYDKLRPVKAAKATGCRTKKRLKRLATSFGRENDQLRPIPDRSFPDGALNTLRPGLNACRLSTCGSIFRRGGSSESEHLQKNSGRLHSSYSSWIEAAKRAKSPVSPRRPEVLGKWPESLEDLRHQCTASSGTRRARLQPAILPFRSGR
jgi:hypothetical protein